MIGAILRIVFDAEDQLFCAWMLLAIFWNDSPVRLL
jgi:hypothetical protein